MNKTDKEETKSLTALEAEIKENKNKNGNNKLERQINKTMKYMGIELKECSNKYLQVVNSPENIYVVVGDSWKLSKARDLIIVSPVNTKKDKPYFFKSFGTLKLASYFHGKSILVKPYFDSDKADFKELSLGCDDIFTLEKFKDMQEHKIIHVEKK